MGGGRRHTAFFDGRTKKRALHLTYRERVRERARERERERERDRERGRHTADAALWCRRWRSGASGRRLPGPFGPGRHGGDPLPAAFFVGQPNPERG